MLKKHFVLTEGSSTFFESCDGEKDVYFWLNKANKTQTEQRRPHSDTLHYTLQGVECVPSYQSIGEWSGVYLSKVECGTVL